MSNKKKKMKQHQRRTNLADRQASLKPLGCESDAVTDGKRETACDTNRNDYLPRRNRSEYCNRGLLFLKYTFEYIFVRKAGSAERKSVRMKQTLVLERPMQ